MPINFKSVFPEEAGISSSDVLSFVKTLDGLGLYTHSLLIAKGDDLIYESYYKPFDADFLHRQYSVSKTFVSVAVGMAVTEGLFSLDDVILDYFPEFKNEITSDGLYSRCRIRDMLTMSSNVTATVYWWGKFKTRVEAYYSQKSLKIPATLYYYDSIGSFLLGVIIQKLTGKDFLEYLKDKVLLELGFSKESYVLREPGGFAVGDSAVMCTLRDLLILARLIACGGAVNGKRYIDETYMKNAVTPLVYTNLYANVSPTKTTGYGYLMRITPSGFMFSGLGDQLAFYDRNRDVTIVLNSDNQGSDSTTDLIYHSFASLLIPAFDRFDKKACANCEETRKELIAYQNSRALRLQSGSSESPLKNSVNGKVYEVIGGRPLGLERFSVRFFENGGRIDFLRNGETFGFDFAFGENKPVRFSFGDRARADMMGVWEKGEYDCVASAGFVSDNSLVILLQVLDTYFGKLHVSIGFGDGEACMHITKRGQYVFDGIEGDCLCKEVKE